MKTEKTVFLIILLAAVMKFFLLPLSAPILIVSLAVLSILYFPLGFYFLSDQSIKKHLGLSILAGFLLYPIPLGILFKLLYWPGSFLLLLGGGISSFLLLIIVAAQRMKTVMGERPYFNKLFFRTILLGIISTLLLFTTDATLVRLEQHKDPEITRLKIQYLQNTENKEYKRLYMEYVIKIDSVENRR